MFDLNEPAELQALDASATAASAAAVEQRREEKDLSSQHEGCEEREEEDEAGYGDEEEEGACSGLSLLAQSAEPKIRPAAEERATSAAAAVQEEIQLEKPGSESRGLSPVSSDENDEDNVSSAAKQWSLAADAAATGKEQRSSSWPRSARPSLVRSPSFQMLFSDERADNNVVDSKADAEELGNRETKGNLCEFFAIEANNTVTATTTTTTSINEDLEVSHDKLCSSSEIDLIDAFGQEKETKNSDLEDGPGESTNTNANATTNNTISSSNTIATMNEFSTKGDPVLDDSRFGTVVWQGQITFLDVKVSGMVAACSRRWQHVFKNRKVADDLTVQSSAGTDKFLGAVKEYVAEPGVRLTQRSSTSSQDLTKLVELLAGGTGVDPGLSLHAAVEPSSSKGAVVAVIPLRDEDKVWFADLYVVAASLLSDAEPGELSSSDEDFLYGFVSVSPGSGEAETYAWLKDEASGNSELKGALSKGDAPVEDKRVFPPPPPPLGDRQQDLEEGQVVSEDQGGKDAVAFPGFERKKRYSEDEKKTKANGENEGKTRDRHRHRDHERDKEQDRERAPRRDRDREVDHRDRDNRDSVYARRSGNYDYLPRLETGSKSARHRDGDKERGAHAWENGGRGPSTRERVRSRSKEREKDRDRTPAEKNAKDTRSKKGAVVETKKLETLEKKKRERSPDYRGTANGKRLKESEDVKAEKHDDGRAGRKARTEVDEYTAKMQTKDKGEATARQHRQSSEERALSTQDPKAKRFSVVTGEDDTEAYVEMYANNCDSYVKSWIPSKQNAVHLREDYGVTLLMDDSDSKKKDTLHIKLASRVTETCCAAEAKYFVRRAADALGDVFQNGVFTKTLWYPGQLEPLSVATVIRTLKGDEGKTLDKIQEATGVMVILVLDGDAKKTASKSSSDVGLRLITARKKGLAEATHQAQALLDQAAMTVARETSVPLAEETKRRTAPQPAKGPLYVTNCPDYASPRMLKAIFENVLREKLKKSSSELPPGFEQSTDMVTDVKCEDGGCAFVEFASDELLNAALLIYAAEKDLFRGLKVELPPPEALKVSMETQVVLAEEQTGTPTARVTSCPRTIIPAGAR